MVLMRMASALLAFAVRESNAAHHVQNSSHSSAVQTFNTLANCRISEHQLVVKLLECAVGRLCDFCSPESLVPFFIIILTLPAQASGLQERASHAALVHAHKQQLRAFLHHHYGDVPAM
jgi:hypothetical protein